MKIPNILGLGFRVFGQLGEQQEANQITNMTYATPYQIAYKGLLLETDKLSSAYDADATPTQAVAVPADNGAYVDGWAYINTYKMHPLPGAANVLYPLTATSVSDLRRRLCKIGNRCYPVARSFRASLSVCQYMQAQTSPLVKK